jgi:hypothetical protein
VDSGLLKRNEEVQDTQEYLSDEEDLDNQVRKSMFEDDEEDNTCKDTQVLTPNTPPLNTRLLLGDQDRTPRSPVIMKTTQSEIDIIKGKNKEDDNMFHVVEKVPPEVFDVQLENSKKNIDFITVQGEEEMHSPIDFPGDVVIEDRKDNFVHRKIFLLFLESVLKHWESICVI